MPSLRAVVVASAASAALAALAAVVVAVVAPAGGDGVEPAPRPRFTTRPPAQGRRHADDAPHTTRPRADAAADAPSTGLSAAISADDPARRNEVALELWRRGPDALTQARALRPSTVAGQELQMRLVDALRRLRLQRRATDHAKLPLHLRLRSELDLAATVVPEELLVEERRACAQAAVDYLGPRADPGGASGIELQLARLELLVAERDAGRLDAAAAATRAAQALESAQSMLARMRADPDRDVELLTRSEARLTRLASRLRP